MLSMAMFRQCEDALQLPLFGSVAFEGDFAGTLCARAVQYLLYEHDDDENRLASTRPRMMEETSGTQYLQEDHSTIAEQLGF